GPEPPRAADSTAHRAGATLFLMSPNRGEEFLSVNPIPGKVSRRLGEANSPMHSASHILIAACAQRKPPRFSLIRESLSWSQKSSLNSDERLTARPTRYHF